MSDSIKKIANRYDSILVGVALGGATPLFSLIIFYVVKYNYLPFLRFYKEILLANNILTPVISLCVIPNLLVFFIFIWTNRHHSARGVLLATMVYACYVVYKKFLL